MKKKRTWLITGGAGFLGLHLCRYLIDQKQDVISFDLAAIPEKEKLDGLLEVTADIRDRAALKKALEKVDIVVHCAAALALAKPEEINSVNAQGAKLVLDCTREAGVKRFIYVGTTAVYGMPKFHPIYEDAPLDPMGHLWHSQGQS